MIVGWMRCSSAEESPYFGQNHHERLHHVIPLAGETSRHQFRWTEPDEGIMFCEYSVPTAYHDERESGALRSICALWNRRRQASDPDDDATQEGPSPFAKP